MRKIVLSLVLFLGFCAQSQSNQSFQAGEWFRFRIHYGIFNASYATLAVSDSVYEGKSVYYVSGRGKSTGLLGLFFKVDDHFESYFDKKTGKPYKYVIKTEEGPTTKDKEVYFDYNNSVVTVKNNKKKNSDELPIKGNHVQDMLSVFYFLRNSIDHRKIENNQSFELDMIYDDELFKFKLKFVKREVLRTKFGKIKTLVFKPYVASGRVFKEEESMTVWVSDDDNKIPLRIKADLAVGSIKADLDAFKGLKHSFSIKVD
ncbi:MAG: DUF3108 domain-containing protein [Flavobacteriaceae bacterium]|nr:DUF3108 domain-containing protein [Flavobacteriaceae bacterium]